MGRPAIIWFRESTAWYTTTINGEQVRLPDRPISAQARTAIRADASRRIGHPHHHWHRW
jgi:hypothetical protein